MTDGFFDKEKVWRCIHPCDKSPPCVWRRAVEIAPPHGCPVGSTVLRDHVEKVVA